eukprot:gene9037-13990_t
MFDRAGYFARLFESEGVPLTHTIDRDPTNFGPLLVYMRKSRFAVDVSELDGASKLQLFEDIMFYDIEGLKNLIEEDIVVERKKDEEAEKTRLVREKILADLCAEDTKPFEGPTTMDAGGEGCYLCGLTSHAERDCRFNPSNANMGNVSYRLRRCRLR